MADNIDVLPATKQRKQSVATDEINDVHYPIYKVSWGSLGTQTSVDTDNPLPISFASSLLDGQLLSNNRIRDELIELNTQMKILNTYLSNWHGEEITEEDIENDH